MNAHPSYCLGINYADVPCCSCTGPSGQCRPAQMKGVVRVPLRHNRHKLLGMLLFVFCASGRARNFCAQAAKFAWGGEHRRHFVPFCHLIQVVRNPIYIGQRYWFPLSQVGWSLMSLMYMAFGFLQWGLNYTYQDRTRITNPLQLRVKALLSCVYPQ